MRLSAEEIRKQIQKAYPKTRNGERVWIKDRLKALPTMKDLEGALKETTVESMKLQDCDDYSLQLRAAINRLDQTWAFGECTGIIEALWGTNIHDMNICLTETGLVIIEPKTDQIFEVDPKQYDLFFSLM